MTRTAAATLLIMATAIAATGSAEARRRVATRPSLHRIAADTAAVAEPDTMVAASLDSLRLSGYDKPLRSRRESLFITNSTSSRLSRVVLAIDYFDTSGRMLHHAEVEAAADIPAGATRQVTFPSWDRQLSFVYSASARSARSRGIPYTVTVSIIRAYTSSK